MDASFPLCSGHILICWQPQHIDDNANILHAVMLQIEVIVLLSLKCLDSIESTN